MRRSLRLSPCLVLLAAFAAAHGQSAQYANPLDAASTHQPFSFGPMLQGGVGVTDDRGGFQFFLAGAHAGRVLTNNAGHGLLRGNFEYAMELFPYWQANTPVFPRISCVAVPNSAFVSCSNPYNVGGTFHGVSLTPIILRWNFAHHGRITPWAQAAGGLLWTNHKFPSYGSTVPNLAVNGPNGETSVWNFTPQGGVGLHYFVHPKRSVEISQA
jgi:lipid A 3-O-deacylase